MDSVNVNESIKVGDSLFYNDVRITYKSKMENFLNSPKELKVTKVGSKYIHTGKRKWEVDTLREISDFNPLKAYRTKQEVLDTIETEILRYSLKETVLSSVALSELSITQLRAIDKIIKEGK